MHPECVCVCVWLTVCVSSSTDASGPTECEMEQGGSGLSHNSLQHTHTHRMNVCATHSRIQTQLYLLLSYPSFLSAFIFYPFYLFPTFISTIALILSPFSCLLPFSCPSTSFTSTVSLCHRFIPPLYLSR
ncbi:hypothetical protein CHARACLAT_002957 [Characodon lateralis]|uniref:Secreted protein n=1 Tax=Characodon lateralis TaxID=208331 RepID=A0ABU7EHB5_9TELE|nr:hypothetical protein [Characodon lateralis]